MSNPPRSRCRGEGGETLAELIVTIGIVGIAVVARSWRHWRRHSASSNHRQRSSADTVARSVAEASRTARSPSTPTASYPPTIWSPTVDTTGFTVNARGATCFKTVTCRTLRWTPATSPVQREHHGPPDHHRDRHVERRQGRAGERDGLEAEDLTMAARRCRGERARPLILPRASSRCAAC